MAAPIYVRHQSSLAHETGMHPERAARIAHLERELAAQEWLGFERVEAPAASEAQLRRVHGARHIAGIRELCARGGGAIDADTVVGEHSYEAALHAAGGAIELVDRLLARAAPSGISALRPPGHHAEPARAMGFCLFDNVAVAARHAQEAHGVERVMIVDWDVHHGNGTAAAFAADASVLFLSVHQSPLYPGTGAAEDAGVGEGEGFTVNVPVPPGSGDEAFSSVLEHVAAPVGRAFAPRLLLVSAGFDAHAADPLADCRVTEAGFAAMAGTVRRLGAELEAPVGLVLEGGYDLGALARSVAATLAVLGTDEVPPAPGTDELEPHPLAVAARERAARRGLVA